MFEFRAKKLAKRGVYLYVFNPGYPMRIYKGNIYVNKTSNKTMLDPAFRESNKDKPYHRACNLEEGVLRHNCFWLRKRDDEKALDLFYAYIKRMIKKCQATIDGHRRHYEEAVSQPAQDFTEEN